MKAGEASLLASYRESHVLAGADDDFYVFKIQILDARSSMLLALP